MIVGFALALVTAKLWVLIALGAQCSIVSLPAYLWQDAAWVVAFALLSAATAPRRWPAASLYAVVLAFTGLSAGMAVATGSPITLSMLRAAGGAMADSVVGALEFEVLAPVSAVGVTGVLGGVAEAVARRRHRERGSDYVTVSAKERATSPLGGWLARATLALAAGLAPIGFFMVDAVPTRGLHHTATVALVRGALPRLSASPHERGRSGEFDLRRSVVSGAEAAEASLVEWRAGSAAQCDLIVVVLESVGARYLRPYGADRDPMPFLTTFAESAVRFDAAWTVYPESIKGFLPLLASRYPAFETQAKSYEFAMPTVSSSLSAQGYRTALYHSGRFDYLGMRSIIEERGFEELIDAAALSGVLDSSFGVEETTTVDRMLADLEEERREAIFYLPIAGHHPYDSPEPGPFSGEGEFSDYLNALHSADRALERFFRGLESSGRLERSLVVIVGDHGQAFEQHPGNLGHVFFLYEENIRVPLFVRLPGGADRGVVDAPVSVIDLPPTILDLLGVPVPSEFQGRSWLESPAARIAFSFTDYAQGWLAARDGRWKLIHELDSGRDQLFDLATDPNERENLADPNPEITGALRERAIEWARDQKRRVESVGR
ncbi:MAG: sulfatase [Planctomycetota bacterium]